MPAQVPARPVAVALRIMNHADVLVDHQRIASVIQAGTKVVVFAVQRRNVRQIPRQP